ncbi:hypothetical protein AVEN_166125-1 [Araneus ventricosus]|uniref:Uncharacterized protein n=1 Tax=Araneus ventricosus TaxID=182803 RepID=A0A4Y2CNS7_ARAVE|nr:hypothetical protein AVEN_244086-1 [Araneus ventricosus]GBM04999.1 hypothetical protein AVEN_47303-1 [Araneus ventricosus]GBM05036.1 hypothetical protein AVEN_131222-1 [Araneus ventricosus]GBM05058.1 hypothetical protein AVEN_166125-1 [Araneus ventricosus]
MLQRIYPFHRLQNDDHSRIASSARIVESHLEPGQDYMACDSFVPKQRTRYASESHEQQSNLSSNHLLIHNCIAVHLTDMSIDFA